MMTRKGDAWLHVLCGTTTKKTEEVLVLHAGAGLCVCVCVCVRVCMLPHSTPMEFFAEVLDVSARWCVLMILSCAIRSFARLRAAAEDCVSLLLLS